jgi:lysozyme family protein
MANFKLAIEMVLRHEGGYVHDLVDLGGETYKGIARNIHPHWTGWVDIDDFKRLPGFPGNIVSGKELDLKVEEFYRNNFWNPIRGDQIGNQQMAESLFDFCVNAGVRTGVAIAQGVLEVSTDGVVGPVTLGRLNAIDGDFFLAAFSLGKIARYIHLVKKRPANSRFFYGWVRRAIGDI